MGWTYVYAPELTCQRRSQVELYVTNLVSWSRDGVGQRVLASAMDGATWYGAVQDFTQAGAGEVFGLVVHTRRVGRAADGYNFGYKTESEDVGPTIARAPMRIIALLSPTGHANALEWRQRCLEALQRRRDRRERNAKVLVKGARLRLPEPVRFSDGVMRQRFILEEREERRFRFRCVETGGLCRLSPVQRGRLLPDGDPPVNAPMRLTAA